MKRLVLVRHAKAVPTEKTPVPDFERELTERGLRDAQRMGRWLRQVTPALDRVVASPSRRTRRTAEAIVEAWDGVPPAIEYEQKLYLPSLDELLSVVWSLPDKWTAVALVGHNPSMSELLDELTGTSHDPMPTCAIAVLAADVEHWHAIGSARCRLEHYATPRDGASR